MRYNFLVDTYKTEIEKVLSGWAMFDDEDLRTRPNRADARGRNILEHMVHQCISEDFWFSKMLEIFVTDNPLPETEIRTEFMRKYAHDASSRLAKLVSKEEAWWEERVPFFDVVQPRTWILLRRIAHTAHHRGQQTTLLRMLNYTLHSTYGPTADTGGLMQNHAPTIYPYIDAEQLLIEEDGERSKAALPGPSPHALTERPTIY